MEEERAGNSRDPPETARRERRTRRLGEDPRQRGGACAAWHAKARSAGLTLSDLVRRSIGRVRIWTVAHAEVERERTRELARLGNNLNRLPLATRPVSTSSTIGSEPYRARTRTKKSWRWSWSMLTTVTRTESAASRAAISRVVRSAAIETATAAGSADMASKTSSPRSL